MDVDSRPHLVEIVAALKEITVRITSATALSAAINDLVKVTAGILPSDVTCAVALVSQGEPAIFAATGVCAPMLDEFQHSDGDDPCLESVRTRGIVLSQDLAQETRWARWSTQARQHGIFSVIAYPFDVDPAMLGALALYAPKPHAFGGEVPILAMLVADHASLLLRVRARQLTREEQLSLAIDHNANGGAEVQRAVGIVMAQRGCPPGQALRHLQEAATHLGVGLPAVAERLVRTVSDRAGVPASS